MKEGALTAFRRFLGIGFFVALFLLVTRYELVDTLLTEKVGLVLQAILYVLSIPVGVFIRLDTLHFTNPSFTPAQLLLAALGAVLVNFIAIGALSGVIMRRDRELE